MRCSYDPFRVTHRTKRVNGSGGTRDLGGLGKRGEVACDAEAMSRVRDEPRSERWMRVLSQVRVVEMQYLVVDCVDRVYSSATGE